MFTEAYLHLTLKDMQSFLSGGDKKGKNQENFYKRLIAQAEIVFETHLKTIQRK
jgi:hypothetical protein